MSKITPSENHELAITAVPEFPNGFTGTANRHVDSENQFWESFIAETGNGPMSVQICATAAGPGPCLRIAARDDNAIAILKPFLPDGYRVETQREASIAEPVAGFEVRLVRRLEIVDLPAERQRAAASNQIHRAQSLSSDNRRQITTLDRLADTAVRCVPTVLRLKKSRPPKRPQPRRWFHKLQQFKDASVTIRVSSIPDLTRSLAAATYEAILGREPEGAPSLPGFQPSSAEQVLPPDRSSSRTSPAVSASPKRVRPTTALRSTEMFSDRGENRRIIQALTLLRLPDSKLRFVEITVRASKADDAVALARLWAESHGGIQAYWFSKPTSLDDHNVCSIVQFGSRGEFPQQILDRLSQLGLANPLEFDAKLIFELTGLMEALYSSSDLHQLLWLPVGPVDGLKSSVVSPFATSIPHPFDDDALTHLGFLATPELLPITAYDVVPDNPVLRSAKVVSVALSQFAKHSAIFGQTGFGKSTLVYQIVRQLMELGIRLTIIDPKTREHHRVHAAAFPDLKRFSLLFDESPGDNIHVLRFDVCRVPPGIAVQTHLANFVSVCGSMFGMHLSLLSFFERGVRMYYTGSSEWACGLRNSTRGGPNMLRIRNGRVFPSFDTFHEFFVNDYIPNSIGTTGNSEKIEEWRQYFTARLGNLWQGPIGDMCREADYFAVTHFGKDFAGGMPVGGHQPVDLGCYDPFCEVVGNNSVIELEELPNDEERAGATLFTVLHLIEHLLAQYHQDLAEGRHVGFQHLLMVEEAHNLCSQIGGGSRGDIAGDDPRARLAKTMTDLLAECRKLGIGACFVSQLPLRMTREIVEMVDMLISFRMTPLRHRKFLGQTMGATPEETRYLSRLDQGKAVVRCSAFESPIQIIIPACGCEPFLRERQEVAGDLD